MLSLTIKHMTPNNIYKIHNGGIHTWKHQFSFHFTSNCLIKSALSTLIKTHDHIKILDLQSKCLYRVDVQRVKSLKESLTALMSTVLPLRAASTMGSRPFAVRRKALACSTSFFCLACRAAFMYCFFRPSRNSSCWVARGWRQRWFNRFVSFLTTSCTCCDPTCRREALPGCCSCGRSWRRPFLSLTCGGNQLLWLFWHSRLQLQEKQTLYRQFNLQKRHHISSVLSAHLFFFLLFIIFGYFSSISGGELGGCFQCSDKPLLRSRRLVTWDRRKTWKKTAGFTSAITDSSSSFIWSRAKCKPVNEQESHQEELAARQSPPLFLLCELGWRSGIAAGGKVHFQTF